MGLFFNRGNQNNFVREMNSTSSVGDIVFERKADILRESLEIMDKTLNPDTYFSRYKLASNKACVMRHNPGVIYKGMDAGEIYEMLNDEFSKDDLHMEFIDRLFDAGRENILAYQIHDVGYSMSQAVRDYIVDMFDGKKFRFCKVSFNEPDNKTYTYITKNRKLQVGDTVTVPTGNKSVPNSKLAQVVETFDASLDELGFPIERLRCIESKLKSISCPHCGASISVDVAEKKGKCAYCSAEFYLI